jgi:leucyl aminopeptidase
MTDILFVKPTLPRAGALVLPLSEGFVLEGLAKEADEATNGAVSRGLEAASFKGKKGQTVTLWAPGGYLSRIVAVGLGATPLEATAAEAAGGHTLPLIASDLEATIAAEAFPADQAAAFAASFALGLRLRAYRFDRYRTKEAAEDKPKLTRVTIATPDIAAAQAAHAPSPPSRTVCS